MSRHSSWPRRSAGHAMTGSPFSIVSRPGFSVPALAQERGPKRDVVAKVPDEPKPPASEKPIAETERPKGRAAVKQWAGFLLSGTGR